MKYTIAAVCSLFLPLASVQADYTKGTTMFQIYGGGAAFGGEYDRSAVPEDDRQYSDPGSMLGGQFLYFVKDSPSLAVGFDIAHAAGDERRSHLLLSNRLTDSSVKSTMGLAIARLSYPKGHFRPYIQGGLGAHNTRLKLDGMPINGTAWSDTSTTEVRELYDHSHAGLAMGGAVGMHIYFTERFFIGAEYKATLLFGNDFKPTTAGRLEGLNNTEGSVGMAGLGLMIGLGF